MAAGLQVREMQNAGPTSGETPGTAILIAFKLPCLCCCKMVLYAWLTGTCPVQRCNASDGELTMTGTIAWYSALAEPRC